MLATYLAVTPIMIYTNMTQNEKRNNLVLKSILFFLAVFMFQNCDNKTAIEKTTVDSSKYELSGNTNLLKVKTITETDVNKAFDRIAIKLNGEDRDCYISNFVLGDLNNDNSTDVVIQFHCGVRDSPGNASAGSGLLVFTNESDSLVFSLLDEDLNNVIPIHIDSSGILEADKSVFIEEGERYPSGTIKVYYKLKNNSLVPLIDSMQENSLPEIASKDISPTIIYSLGMCTTAKLNKNMHKNSDGEGYYWTNEDDNITGQLHISSTDYCLYLTRHGDPNLCDVIVSKKEIDGSIIIKGEYSEILIRKTDRKSMGKLPISLVTISYDFDNSFELYSKKLNFWATEGDE